MLIGAPMYNFSIPSTLKAWLDQVIIIGHTAGPEGSVAGDTDHRRGQPWGLVRPGNAA